MVKEDASLDPNQAARLLTWLDEEHRKDKAMLVELQSQVNAQKVLFTEQARQLQAIQATLTRIEGQLPRIGQLEGAYQGIRGEFATLLSQHAAEEESRAEQRSEGERQASEALARATRALQERVDALGTFDATVAVLREEDSKLRSELTKVVSQLSETSQSFRDRFSSIEGLQKEVQMTRDSLATLQTAHDELSNRSLSIRPAIDNVAVRLDTKISQLESLIIEIEGRHQGEKEAVQRRHSELARQMDALAKELVSAQAPLNRWSQQLEEFSSAFENNRKALYDLHELEKQMRQQGAEVVELQRIAAERQRTALREWQDKQVSVDEQQTIRLDQLDAVQTKLRGLLEELGASQERTQRDLVAYVDELWRAWVDYMQAQAKLLDSASKQRRTHR